MEALRRKREGKVAVRARSATEGGAEGGAAAEAAKLVEAVKVANVMKVAKADAVTLRRKRWWVVQW